MRLALDRIGGSWDKHPLSSWPEAIQVAADTGRPTFLYGDGSALRTYELRPGSPVPWKAEPPSELIEGFISEGLMELTLYSETGEIIGHEPSVREAHE